MVRNVPDSARTTGTLFNLDAVVQKKRPLIYVYDFPPDFNSLLLDRSLCFIIHWEWPEWLRPSHIDVPDSARTTGTLFNLDAVVQKKRPLIYVYDFPPDFNSLLLDGRHFKLGCVNRMYDHRNGTIWTDQLYGSPWVAEFLDTHFYKNAYEHIMLQYPYWNRTEGKDHIWFFSWDEGACYAPKEIWNSMMLVHWDNTNSKHNGSTTAYWADNWNTISFERRGNHTCFDPQKDLVLPAWKSPEEGSLTAKYWPREERKTLFYFNGNLGHAYEHGRPEETYCMGIRQKVAEEFGWSPNKEGKLGKQHSEDVVATPERAENYHLEIASSVFCGVMPGDGWSGRMEDSILQGCIPVVIQDGIYLPYENLLNYDIFAVQIGEDEIPNLINILRSMDEAEVELKLANVRKIWQRFLYRDSILLEAARQNATIGLTENWATKFHEIEGDDAFTTLVQILHYKLHNDPWRRDSAPLKKDFGLPREC
ncbi:hypothetical protein OROMI_019492 [Orobanche minor]